MYEFERRNKIVRIYCNLLYLANLCLGGLWPFEKSLFITLRILKRVFFSSHINVLWHMNHVGSQWIRLCHTKLMLKKNLTIVQSNWKYSSRFREILQEILWEILRDPSRHPLGYGSPASILVAHVEASAEALLRPWQSGSSDHFHMASAKWGGTKAALSAKFN